MEVLSRQSALHRTEIIRRVAALMMRQSLIDLVLYKNAKEPEKQRLAERAEAWFLGEDRGWSLTFGEACDLLNFPEDATRAKALKLTRQEYWQKRSVARQKKAEAELWG
jgi:hypothetical protein